jgi:hypothetical protein
MGDNEVYPVTGPMVYDAYPSIGSALSLVDTPSLDSVRSICSDGDYLYVLWRSTTPNYAVTRFYMQSPTPVHSGTTWLNFDHSDADYSKVIVASNDRLAVSSDNISGDMGVVILSKLGSTRLTGNGNCTISSSVAANGRLVSDGVHVYWLSRRPNNGFEVSLFSAKISDPTTSDYSSHVVFTDTYARAVPHGLYNIGGSSTGSIACVAPTGGIWLFNKEHDEVLPALQLSGITAPSAVDYSCVCGSDGINVWIQTHSYNVGYDTNKLVFVKVPMAVLTSSNCQGSGGSLASFTPSIVHASTSLGLIEEYESGRMLFDGVDMWFVSRSGFAVRITAPGMR